MYKVVIRNYKSIDSLELELSRVTLLIGPPAAGKSNILEAIALAGYPWRLTQENIYGQPYNIRPTLRPIIRSHSFSEGFEVIFPRYDFTRSVRIALSNDSLATELSIKYEAGGLRIKYCNYDISNIFIKCLNQVPDQWLKAELPKFEARLYGFDRYDYVKNLRFITGSTYQAKLEILLENGENLPDIIGRFSEILIKVNEFLADYLETRTEIRYLEIEKRLVTFDYYREISPSLLADGIWRIIYYAAALYSAKQYAHVRDLKDRLILLLEEPDAHTFPYVVYLLIDLIREVSEYAYVILTTHNGILASMIADKISDATVYYVYRNKYGWTTAIKIDVNKLAKYVIELSDLLLMRPEDVVEKFAEKSS